MRFAVVFLVLFTLPLRAEGDRLSGCEVPIQGTAKGGSIAFGLTGAPETVRLEVETQAGETPAQVAQKFVAASAGTSFSDRLTVLDGRLFVSNASPGKIFVKVNDAGLVRVENVSGLKAIVGADSTVTLTWTPPKAVEGKPALFRIHIIQGARSIGSVTAETVMFVDDRKREAGTTYRVLCQYKGKNDGDFYSDLVVVSATNP